jgi:hypothetical protein
MNYAIIGTPQYFDAFLSKNGRYTEGSLFLILQSIFF